MFSPLPYGSTMVNLIGRMAILPGSETVPALAAPGARPPCARVVRRSSFFRCGWRFSTALDSQTGRGRQVVELPGTRDHGSLEERQSCMAYFWNIYHNPTWRSHFEAQFHQVLAQQLLPV